MKKLRIFSVLASLVLVACSESTETDVDHSVAAVDTQQDVPMESAS